MKWGMQAFDTFGVVPPGFGIVHQVNLEYLARGVLQDRGGEGRAAGLLPRLAGRHRQPHDDDQRHRRGRLGRRRHRGRGGDARPAGLLPDARRGRLRVHRPAARRRHRDRPGALRHRDPAQARRWSASSSSSSARASASLAVPDRATIGQHGARVRRDDGLLPGRRQDDRVLRGHRPHARPRSRPSRPTSRRRACSACRAPARSTTRKIVTLDLGTVTPSLAGPKRPQDRIELGNVKKQFTSLFSKPPTENGFNQPAAQLLTRHLVRAADARSGEGDGAKCRHALGAAGRAALRRGDGRQQADARRGAARGRAGDPAHGDMTIGNGDVLIAAITSCTNTSNPSVLLAAGLLAKKAVEAGLTVKPHIKTSLAPGSRIVTEYLDEGRPAALPREARLQRRRLRLHHLHRQRRRPDARDQRGDHQERPGLRRGAVGQPQLRGAHPPEPEGQLPRQPAAGGGLRDRRHGAARPDDRAGRQGQGRQGRLPRRHLADQRRDRAR